MDATPLTVPTGGVPRYTISLATALAECYPHDQYWLVSDQPFPSAARAPANLRSYSSAVSSSPANGLPAPGLTEGKGQRWWLSGLPRKLAQLGADVFHGTDFSVPYIPLRPSVMTVSDLSPWLNPSWQPGAQRIRRRTPFLLRSGICTMVITHSEAIRRAAIAHFQLPPDRVVAVPLAASPNFRPVRGPSAAGTMPYFLYVGTLEPRKNVAALIEAWRHVRRTRNVDLVLAGRVREDFPPPDPEQGLRLLGAVEERDLPELYSNAAASVYPSLYEGFGLPVLEAMQCGGLVITSNDPAITEVTGGASHNAALHVDAADTKALAGALAAALRSPTNFDSLRQRAVARAAEFSWSRTAHLTREVYDAARRIF